MFTDKKCVDVSGSNSFLSWYAYARCQTLMATSVSVTVVWISSQIRWDARKIYFKGVFMECKMHCQNPSYELVLEIIIFYSIIFFPKVSLCIMFADLASNFI